MTRLDLCQQLAIFFCATLILQPLTCASRLSASPHLPAEHIQLKLSEVAKGKLLINELNCAACHADDDSAADRRRGPDLTHVSQRVRPDYIERMLLNPQKIKPGTLMPNVLGRLSVEKRKAVATAIAQYLSQPKQEEAISRISQAGNKQRGKERYHSVGCVACHPPLEDRPKTRQLMGLAHLHEKYTEAGLKQFLFEPLKARPSGRMPDMKLTRQEAADLASYLLSFDKVAALNKPVPGKTLLAQGNEYFEQFNCTACHEKDNPPASPTKARPLFKPMKALNSADCRGPVYDLSEAQKAAITAALKLAKPLERSEKIKLTMATFNCYACHERDGLGGVSDNHPKAKWFKTTEPELGNAGKYPPSLTGVGAKLQRRWMHRVLFEGESLRPYMLTRMPQFGKAKISGLPPTIIDDFAVEDKIEPSNLFDIKIIGKERRTFREAGRKLVGTDGYSCISCHHYNGHPSLGLKAFDLVSTAERIKPDWFYHYMINPNRFRPGIVMPSFWPDGKALRKDVMDGDTRKQLRAMWHYFTFGQTQGLPKGLKIEPTRLITRDQVLIYRGRSGVAGFRGIAIGFPEKVNLAFDAEMMNVRAIWAGEFVNINWRGQAAGDFSPTERSVIRFNEGVPFARLIQNDDPWPTRRKKGDPSKDNKDRTNMDPLFVKRLGYQFKGYYFDPRGLPVLTYQYEDALILDQWQVKGGRLLRTLTFESPRSRSFFMRLATGKLEVNDKDKGIYQLDKLRIKAPEPATIVGQELRLKVSLPKGQSKFTIDYQIGP